MRPTLLALLLVTLGSPAAFAQHDGAGSALLVPRFDVSVGYNYIRANAPPPGGCECFGLQGGAASFSYHITDWLSAAGEFTGGRAGNISALGQNLTLFTVAGGPRVQLTGRRFVPFGQALFGIGHGSDSYFPTGTTYSTSATNFALQAGGGVDFSLNRRFSVRAFDVEYLRTTFPNGSTNTQQQLMVGAGVVVKFRGMGLVRHHEERAEVARPSEITFTCSTASPTVEQGRMLDIVGYAHTEPDQVDLNYTWSSDAGAIVGNGRRVSINTMGVAPGSYHIYGRVSLASSPSTMQDCNTSFQVAAPAVAAAPAPTPTMLTVDPEKERVFHENVQDALFDYDSYKIRPDAQAAIDHAAKYMSDNPALAVTVGGYADDRGSAEYNLALGVNRANAARDALIAAGVSGDRIKIISYGKESQVCAAQNEACWQQNRRAAFQMQH
ncbi:OmpA family protein [Granulicella sp. WH15]|uniref:OmpA family protein n=1 Tax=Granulicella sp. WH15 TaxID=2602070 RepID=UPI001366EDDD|nr:OmpA family protein [Granulicella sp. WH15]QHN05214.1 OmpA family protein [Granulicella sp. WH15]